MKTTKVLLGALRVSALIALFTIAMPAQAQVINVDVNVGSNSLAGTYSGLGAAPDSGTVWNALTVFNQAVVAPTYTASGLVTSTGASTGVSVSISSPYLSNAQDLSANPAPFANALLADFAYPYIDAEPITISGLTGTKYNLYIYSQNAGYESGGGSFTFGGTTLESANTHALSSTAFIQGNNYVEFVGLTPVSGDITGTLNLPDAGSNGASYFNGLQLVNETPAVPEPSTYALMGLGALALLVVSRRRKA